MTDHYSGHDPAKGCGIMIVAAAFGWMVILVLILAAVTWWPW